MRTKEEIVENLIDKEILMNCNYLVEDIQKQSYTDDSVFQILEFENDTNYKIIEELEEDLESLNDQLKVHLDIDYSDYTEKQYLKYEDAQQIIEQSIRSVEAGLDLAREEFVEIFEFWFVSKYLYEKLQELKVPVCDSNYGLSLIHI